jgi:hypothetical protein
MDNDNNNQEIYGGEQTPEVLSRNLKISGEDTIKFLVNDMIISQSGVIKETGIFFESGVHQRAIGVIRPKTTDEDHVRQSYIEIDKTVNILSLLYSVGDWVPQSPSEFQIKTSITLLMNQTHLERVDDVFKSISNKMNDEEMEIYFRALGWYRHGVNAKSLFNKFLAFYNSIENFSDGYYSKHKSELKKSKTGKNECIQKLFEKSSITLISEIKREHINNCYEECLQISSKDKMKFAFGNIFEGDDVKISEFSNKFFDKDDDFKSIRNGIAHADLSEYRENDKELVKNNLFEIQHMARDFFAKIIS